MPEKGILILSTLQLYLATMSDEYGPKASRLARQWEYVFLNLTFHASGPLYLVLDKRDVHADALGRVPASIEY